MRFNQSRTSMNTKKPVTSKLVLGFLGVATTALVGSAGIANAAPGGHHPVKVPTSKAQCMHGGWKKLGYKNQGQCIKAFEEAQKGKGGGYGGGSTNNVNNNVTVTVSNSNNNVINVIINYFFGS